MKKLRVGGVPEHFNLPWHLAGESNRFIRRSVDVGYRDFPGGTGAMMKALRENDIDVAIVLTQGAVADILKGNPSRIVKVYVESPLIWGIHVAANSEIDSVDQIQGRKFAVSRRGSGSHLMSIVDAAERGWETDSLDFEIVGNLTGARKALADGTAEIFLWERFTTQPYVDNGEFRRVGVRETGWPAFVICVRQDVLAADRESVKAMLDAINSQCQELMDDESAVRTISKRYDLELSQTEAWFATTQWSVGFAQPTASIEKVISYLNRLEIVDAPDAVPSDVWTDVSSKEEKS